MPKNISAKDIPLVPESDFRNAVRKVLSNTKQKSDRDLARFQASNLKKRELEK